MCLEKCPEIWLKYTHIMNLIKIGPQVWAVQIVYSETSLQETTCQNGSIPKKLDINFLLHNTTFSILSFVRK